MFNIKSPAAVLQPVYEYSVGKRDSELEQSVVRILIGIALLAYLLHQREQSDELAAVMRFGFVLAATAFFVSAILICVLVVRRRGNVPLRRLGGIALDVSMLSYLFIRAGSHAAPLYFVYLWIIIGNGFRFGKPYLFAALLLSLAGFGLAIHWVPYWSSQPDLSLGMWGGMLLISLYFSTLVGRLYSALERAEFANRAKRQFISSVSHELRTPLNAIIGMLDLLKSTNVDAEQLDILECMGATSQVMLSQIGDVLDFSKIEAGKMAVEEATFDLYKLVFGIVEIFRYRVDPVAIEFGASIACNVPHAVRGDPGHLRQILVNLLGNAVKFTEQGRIRLLIRRLDCEADALRLRFAVTDTGVGIPYEAQHRIFESFAQADESTARRYGGTGLGTTICRQLVELMGGRIGFSSEPGVGSEFWFELPLAELAGHGNDAQVLRHDIRCLVISANAERLPVVADLIELCASPVQLVDEFEAGLARLEQSFLLGKPVRLVILDEALRSDADVDLAAYGALLRERVLALRAAACDAALTLALLMPEGLSAEHADELAELAGFSMLLPAPVERIFLQRLLHAHRLMLDGTLNKKAVPAPVPAAAAPKVISLPQAVDPARYHVLIAEDNPTNRKVLQKILERAGHRCTPAKDGEEALDMLEKKDFDALVLDMNMPVTTGLDVARAYCLMRHQSVRAPIIMFSANVTPEAKEESLDAGADHFLPKPIKVEQFLEVLDQLVAGFRQKSSVPMQAELLTQKLVSKLVRPEEPTLSLESMADLEKVSRDPSFLDELIREFIVENRKLVQKLEVALAQRRHIEVKELLHALKGSALSVGATALKMLCKRIEKMNRAELEARMPEIIQALKKVFNKLCEELEDYRQQRHRHSSPDV